MSPQALTMAAASIAEFKKALPVRTNPSYPAMPHSSPQDLLMANRSPRPGGFRAETSLLTAVLLCATLLRGLCWSLAAGLGRPTGQLRHLFRRLGLALCG